jgi:hypothetical protein
MSEGNGAAVARRMDPPEQPSANVAIWTPDFATSIDQAVERVEKKRAFYERVMREETPTQSGHYGKLAGSNKDVLLKAGAELLLSNMGLYVELVDESAPIIDLDGSSHRGEAFIAYRRTCRIYRQVGPTEHERIKVTQASGSCNSWEVKYRYRESKRACTACGIAAIIPGKKEYGGGWLCFKKQGGCGAKFEIDDPAIVDQKIGRVPNPDVADLDNTILKMADKRALVAATLLATGCSDIFTQDIEDTVPPREVEPARDDAPPADGTQKATPTSPLPTMVSLAQRAFALKVTPNAEIRSLVQWATKNVEGCESGLGKKEIPLVEHALDRYAEDNGAPAEETPASAPQNGSTAAPAAAQGELLPPDMTAEQKSEIGDLLRSLKLKDSERDELVGIASKRRVTSWFSLDRSEADRFLSTLRGMAESVTP